MEARDEVVTDPHLIDMRQRYLLRVRVVERYVVLQGGREMAFVLVPGLSRALIVPADELVVDSRPWRPVR